MLQPPKHHYELGPKLQAQTQDPAAAQVKQARAHGPASSIEKVSDVDRRCRENMGSHPLKATWTLMNGLWSSILIAFFCPDVHEKCPSGDAQLGCGRISTEAAVNTPPPSSMRRRAMSDADAINK